MSSGMLFWIVIAPKSLGNFILLMNVVPGIVAKLHDRCRQQGLDTTYVYHPCFKPSLNSIVIPYVSNEKPMEKLCLGHLPVVEIIPSWDEELNLAESSSLTEELFTLHQNVSFFSSNRAISSTRKFEIWNLKIRNLKLWNLKNWN